MILALRKYTLEDASTLASLANDYEVSKNLRDAFPYPYTKEDADRFISFVSTLSSHKGIEFAITLDDVLVGSIGITFMNDIYRKTAEIGYWLGKDYWQQGIITKTIEIIVPYIFENFPIHKITAEVFSDNIGSQKALERNGFILEGILQEHIYKEHQYHDVKLYGLCK